MMKQAAPETTLRGDDDDSVSALADGALAGGELAATLQHLATDGRARAQWHAYHLIGDALRSPELARGGAGDLAFLQRLEARLAAEPAPERTFAVPPAVALPQREAANQDLFRWKLVAGLASLAAVAVVGWQALALQAPAAAGRAVLAQGEAAPQPGLQLVRGGMSTAPDLQEPASASAPVMLRNAQLDELLAAHNRAVGGAALQSQVRLLRNVSVTEDFTR